LKKPCIVINVENEYSSVVLAGTLWMKGCEVYLANSPDECLKIIKDLNRVDVDVVVIGAEYAMDRAAILIVNIKKLSMDIKILAVGDESSDKTRIIDYGADEFTVKPMSMENVADKAFILIARDALKEGRENEVCNQSVNQRL
jgi:DNA-binding response OmpR family regulator